MFEAPLNTILNSGLLGAILVLSLLVNGWQANKREHDRKELLESYNRRLQDAQTMGQAYNSAVNGFTETMREQTRQIEQSSPIMLAVSKGVEQLLYRKGGK